ncbi:MAG: hypothetical protein HY735_35065 [Verrucomicrobia bacterium]|nr:hypothetical protein [Verrucomicrobiota bacterium]
MKPMLDLLIELRRAEGTEQAVRKGHLTPREAEAVQIRLRLLRDTIPRPVLAQYAALKVSAPDLLDCPAILAMATLVAAYRGLSPRKRKKLNSFFDLAGCRIPESTRSKALRRALVGWHRR